MKYLALLCGLLLASTLPYLVDSASAISYLSHDYDEINIFKACSYYNIENFNELSSFNLHDLKIDYETEVIGALKNPKIEFEYIKQQNVETFDGFKIEYEEFCELNGTCYDIATYEEKFIQTVVNESTWMPYESFHGLYQTIPSIKFKQSQKARICYDIERETTMNGQEISVDHVPEYLGVSYPEYVWYNDSWSTQADIEVCNNNATDILYANTTTVNVSLSTLTDFISANCNDIRVVVNDRQEIDRNVTNCNQPNMQVFFSLQENIATSSCDSTTYKIYTGNPTASVGLNNMYNVYTAVPDALKPSVTMSHIFEMSNWVQHINDSSTNNNNGTEIKANTKNTYSRDGCAFSTCLNMEDNSVLDTEYDIPPSAELDTGTGNFAFSMWVKLNSTNSQEKVLVDTRRPTGELGSLFSVNAGLQAFCQPNGNGAGAITTVSTRLVREDVWEHLFFLVNETTCTIYINGVNDATTTGTAQEDLFPAGYSIHVGARFDAGDGDYGGQIDNFYWYDAHPTAQQIDEMYYLSGTDQVNAPTTLGAEGGKPLTLDIVDPSPINVFVNNTNDILINITITENVAYSCLLEWKGVNETMHIATPTVFYVEKLDLLNQNYSYSVWCNDTNDFWGFNGTYWIFMNKSIPVSTITFCLDEDYLYSRNVIDITENGDLTTIILERPIFCHYGCVNVTLSALGLPGCRESDFGIAVVVLISMVLLGLLVRWVLK